MKKDYESAYYEAIMTRIFLSWGDTEIIEKLQSEGFTDYECLRIVRKSYDFTDPILEA